jgi:hypothetical protein
MMLSDSKEIFSMYRSTSVLAVSLLFLAGCASSAYNVAAVSQQQGDSGYCHKKLQPVGPTDPATTAQSGSGDYIDYSGPCDGPSLSEQAWKQRRFERFRFGRDYMDEG